MELSGLSCESDDVVGLRLRWLVLFDGSFPAFATLQCLFHDPIYQEGHREVFQFCLVVEGGDEKPLEGRGVMGGFGHKERKPKQGFNSLYREDSEKRQEGRAYSVRFLTGSLASFTTVS